MISGWSRFGRMFGYARAALPESAGDRKGFSVGHGFWYHTITTQLHTP